MGEYTFTRTKDLTSRNSALTRDLFATAKELDRTKTELAEVKRVAEVLRARLDAARGAKLTARQRFLMRIVKRRHGQ